MLGFITSDGLMVIDEVQRAPELLLAIKEAVDPNPVPGRFLLTGSARLLALRSVPDALLGRMKRSSYGHYLKVRSIAVPKASSTLSMQLAPSSDTRPLRGGMVISSGSFGAGFPRRSPGRLGAVSVADIINRDVMQISEIEKGPAMRAMVRMLAARSGQLLVPAALAKDLGLPQPTVTRYLTLLEEVFLIKRLPSWSRRPAPRAIKTLRSPSSTPP
jgi:predicted AAA+ superfamily ATPase